MPAIEGQSPESRLADYSGRDGHAVLQCQFLLGQRAYHVY